MKGKIITGVFVSLFLAIGAFAQAKPNFAGAWELDAGKSKFPDTMQVESMSMIVAQTDKELKITSAARITGNASARRGAKTSVNETIVYTLETGKTSESQIGSGIMTGKETRQARFTSDGKLSLTIARVFDNEMGKVTTKVNETWELADGGKTLKVVRYDESPKGATNSEMYFSKKPKGIKTIVGTSNAPVSNTPPIEPTETEYRGEVVLGEAVSEKTVSGGVLNEKSTVLVKPPYPPAAKAVRASGSVNVQVTIDEQGNVISASAISGHPLLRAASENAARESKFAPTTLSGMPVKVTGIIVYNFNP